MILARCIRTKKYRFILPFAVLMTSSLFINTGISGGNTENVVIYALPYDFTEYSYYSMQSYATQQWVSAVYGSLIKRSSNSNHHYVPELAASMPTTSDGLTWRFILNPDAKFSSGNTVTADDVVFSFKVAADQKINMYQRLDSYLDTTSAVKVNATTVDITLLSQPTFPLDILAQPIIEQAVFLQRYNNCNAGITAACTWNDPTGSDAVSAGPFMISNIAGTTEITLVRNPYYIQPVESDKLVFRTYFDTNLAIQALNSGEIDILNGYYSAQASQITNGSYAIVSDLSWQEISLNHQSPYYGTGLQTPNGILNPLDAPAAALSVRRAMSLVADRTLYSNDYMNGLAQPIGSTMPPGSLYWDPSIPADPYDINSAKAMMEDAGYNFSTLVDTNVDGVYETFFFNITVLSPNTNPARNQWSQHWAEQLPKIGIGFVYQNVGWDVIVPRTFGYTNSSASGTYHVPLWDDGGYDVLFVGYGNKIGWDPTGLYENTSFIPNGGNFYNYVNATTQTTIENYAKELNLTKKANYAYDLQKAIHDDLPVIPLLSNEYVWGFAQNISGIGAVLLSAGQLEWENVLSTPRPVTSTTTTVTSSTTVTSNTSSVSTSQVSSTTSSTSFTTSTTSDTGPTTVTVTANSSELPTLPAPLATIQVVVSLLFVGIMTTYIRRYRK